MNDLMISKSPERMIREADWSCDMLVHALWIRDLLAEIDRLRDLLAAKELELYALAETVNILQEKRSQP